jgi:translation initiation factor 1
MDFKFDDDDDDDGFSTNSVTISVNKRNGKKCITSVIGLAKDLDLKKILSYIKKKYSCNGAIIDNEEYGEVMTFTGDQKKNIYDFLIKEEINKKDEITLKGI